MLSDLYFCPRFAHSSDACGLTMRCSQPLAHSMHTYEIRPRKDGRGFDLISDAVPSGGAWYLKVADAIASAKYRSRSHDAVIHVYNVAGKLIEVHRHKGDFKEP